MPKELEIAIKCPGLESSSKSRFSLVDLNRISNDIFNNSEQFAVRILMINECKKLGQDNRCDLSNNYCIFGELPPIERVNYEEDVLSDQNDY